MNNNLIPAATVLVLKDSDVGMEVLMVKRSKRPPFENLYVFPGGKIDKDDHFDDYHKYCDVLNNEIASEKLGLDSGGLVVVLVDVVAMVELISVAPGVFDHPLDFLKAASLLFNAFNFQSFINLNDFFNSAVLSFGGLPCNSFLAKATA